MLHLQVLANRKVYRIKDNINVISLCPVSCLQTEEYEYETTPTERPPLDGEVIAKFAVRGCHVASVTDPYGRIFGFLDRSRYYFFQVAPQLYSRG
jgi:hypothetical protein